MSDIQTVHAPRRPYQENTVLLLFSFQKIILVDNGTAEGQEQEFVKMI